MPNKLKKFIGDKFININLFIEINLSKINKFIYVKWQELRSKSRLFKDYLTKTTLREYEEEKNNIDKITIWDNLFSKVIDNVTIAIFFGFLIWLMLISFGMKLSFVHLVGLSIAYGLLRHCLKRIFNKEI